MGGIATFWSIIAALFIGFLQLPQALLIVVAAMAVYGMGYYHPDQFDRWTSYVRPFLVSLLILSLTEWVARLASLYMTGHSFFGRVE